MYRLPLFPLPVVLLPGAPLPLHVFEPRYRQMVAHRLEGDRRFGLLYHDPDRGGPFEMRPGLVGCVAEILEFRPVPDGRSFLLTRGAERFRLEDGIESDSLYHEGLVEEFPDRAEDAAEVAEAARGTVARFRRVLGRAAGGPQALPPLDAEEPVSFQLARMIRIDPAWQQQLLETPTEGGRLRQLDALLDSLLEAGD